MAYASPVVAATATGIAVNGSNFPVPTSATFDGVTVSNGQRVLLTGQGTLGTPVPQSKEAEHGGDVALIVERREDPREARREGRGLV
jgi:hypothetical protein